MHIIIVILGSLIANYGGHVANQMSIRNKLDVMADSAYTYCLTNDYEPRFFLLSACQKTSISSLRLH